jgi:t-SNARE complex subunit (syntaxin)
MQVQTEISLLDHRLSMIEDQLDELKKELSEVSTKTTQLVDALSDNPLTQKKGIASDISDLKKKVHEHEEIVKKIKWSWWWIISIASVVSFLVQLILKLVS